MSKKSFYIRRLTMDAVLIALYFVFGVVFAKKFPTLEISFASIPILLCALLFGVKDALAVSLFGSFIEQMLGAYGLTVTAPLWMAPVVMQGAVAALLFFLMKKDKIWKIVFAVVLAELLLTVTNTAVLYIDGAIWGYSPKALHIIAPARLINGLARTVASAAALSLLYKPLRRFAYKK